MSADALHRIGAVQRFVEHEDPGIGDERGGDLGPLAHALAEPVDAPIGDVEQRHGGEGRVGRAAVGDAPEVGGVAHELAGRQPGRARPRPRGRGRGGRGRCDRAGVGALDRHPSLVDADHAGHRPHQRRLAGAVGPEQPGDAGAEGAAQVGQGDLRAEPHRHVGDLDRRLADEGRVDRSDAGQLTARPSGSATRSTAVPVATMAAYRARASTAPLATPPSGDRRVDVAEEHHVAQVQRQGERR